MKTSHTVLPFLLASIAFSASAQTVRPERPRILVTSDNLSTIRTRILDPNSAANGYFADTLATAIDVLAETPDGGASYIERKLVPLAFVYVMGEVPTMDYQGHTISEFGAAAVEWLRVYANKFYTSGPNNGYAAHEVFEMSLAYDWVHPVLSAADKAYIAERMVSAADYMHAMDCKFWFSDYTLGCYSFTIAGLALYGDDIPLDISVWWERYGNPQHELFEFQGSSDTKASEYVSTFVSQLIDESFPMWRFATLGGGSFQSMIGHSGDLFMWVRLLESWRTATGQDLLSDFDYLTQHPYFWTYGLVPYLKDNATTPASCGDALINTDNEPFYSDLLPITTNAANTGASILTTLLPNSEAAGLWRWFQEQHLYQRYQLGTLQKIYLTIWFDDAIAPRSPTNLVLPKTRLFGTLDGGDQSGATSHPGGPGIILMRSAWSDPAATLAIFKPRPFFFLHQDADSNSFAILRKGNLAIDSGKYIDGDWSDHEANYAYRSIAHNVVQVHDPSEDFGSYVNDGGQRIPTGSQRLIANYTVGSTFDIGARVVLASVPDAFDYIESDNTRAYSSTLYTDRGNTGKLSEARRKLIYLRSPGGSEDFFIVWDWVVATDASFRTYWQLHSKYIPRFAGSASGGATPNSFGGTPGTHFDGSRFLVTEKRGQLFVDSLEPPAQRYVLVGGPDSTGAPNTDDSYEFVVDGQQHKTGDPRYAVNRYRPFFGAWRVEVEDTQNSAEHLFLQVLYPRDIRGIVLDNLDGSFSTNGSWSDAGSGLEYVGSNYVQAAGDSGGTARWTPNLPGAGQWNVAIMWNDDSGCDGVPVRVHHANGDENVTIDQRGNFDGVLAGDWYSLGTFSFEAGSAGYIELTAQASCDQYKRVQADAVRFVRAADTPFSDVPPAQRILSSDGSMVGAHVQTSFKDKVVMMSARGETHTSVLYNVDTRSALEHLVVDLEPSYSYEIYRDGTLLFARTSSTAGAVHFESVGGGAFQITQGAYVNQPPVARAGEDISARDDNGDGREQIALDGTASTDVDGTIVSHHWSESGSQIASGGTASVALPVGEHTIELEVMDDDGASATDLIQVTVLAGSTDGGVIDSGAPAGEEEEGCSCSHSSYKQTVLFSGRR